MKCFLTRFDCIKTLLEKCINYYYTLAKANKDIKNDKTMNTIKDISIHINTIMNIEERNKGYMINHKKIKRLISAIGLYGVTPKAKE